ncbi:MAG: GIY-YIG nuclease family protein [Alphaproteobacteria bacterium]|nr:MAG: GIY-YIG nuclease family protein [Alphaproteobacteria bacterium]
MNKGRTLKLFLVDGVPQGLLTAEIMNWTGHVITGSRGKLTELVQRSEAKRAGVYLLAGPDTGTGVGTQVYLGETDDVATRLKLHNRPEDKGGKDFWERVCIITSKDANLTKGHVKYLESRLITVAQAAGRCVLVNGTDPQYENLPEADRSDMEFFLEQIQTLLPVLGFDYLRAAPQAPAAKVAGDTSLPQSAPQSPPVFVGDIKKHEITARAQEIEGEFVVMKGSKARLHWEGVNGTYTLLFEQLVKAGVLVPTPDGRHNEFTKSYAFSSPSAAAAVVAGRSANGRTHWVVDGSGKTYAEWQEEQVGQIVPPIAPLDQEDAALV